MSFALRWSSALRAAAVCALLCPTLAHGAAPESRTLSLEQARSLAVSHSPALRAKRAQLEQAQGRLQTAQT